ncbi:hypothetical protein HAX54_007269 [Datura stramonium]|uniref:Uncharacterized protein n=1 Tax=Datura stramonium TaxID=4076 RepID=A0ABS8TBH7_DATST|nr:hypothetical protein [Datura stramonium]
MVVKQAMVAWGDTSSKSDQGGDNQDDTSMYAQEDGTSNFDSIFTLMLNLMLKIMKSFFSYLNWDWISGRPTQPMRLAAHCANMLTRCAILACVSRRP